MSIVATAICKNKMKFYELIDTQCEEPVLESPLNGATPVLIPLPSWSHIKQIYFIGTGLLHIQTEFTLPPMPT